VLADAISRLVLLRREDLPSAKIRGDGGLADGLRKKVKERTDKLHGLAARAVNAALSRLARDFEGMRESDVAALVPNPFASARTEDGEGPIWRGSDECEVMDHDPWVPLCLESVWAGKERDRADTEVSEADLYLQIARRKDGGGRQTVSGDAVGGEGGRKREGCGGETEIDAALRATVQRQKQERVCTCHVIVCLYHAVRCHTCQTLRTWQRTSQ
jgi:hypothetical protein